MLAGTVDIVHCESEQKTETGFSKSDAGQRVSSRDLRTDGSSVGRQETRLLASDLALLKSVQQKIVQTNLREAGPPVSSKAYKYRGGRGETYAP